MLDEIGRMELFSDSFRREVTKAFDNANITILATIPIPKAKPVPFIEKLRQHPKSTVITVSIPNMNLPICYYCKVLTRLYVPGRPQQQGLSCKQCVGHAATSTT